MPKLKMMMGIPGSGKSTYARELVDQGSWGRVNRDDLRAMVFNGKWSGHREGIIVEIEKAIASVLLKNNHAVVVDDTNINEKNRKMWSEYATRPGYQFEVQKMDTPYKTCLERDAAREKPVGEAVINRMALNAGMIDFFGLPIVLVDIDGTLASGEHREGHLKGPRKDWKTYYSLLSEDTPIDFVVRWVRELYKDHCVCLVSGRPDTYQHETLAWLRKHDVPFNFLFMRAGNDKREDFIVKGEILDKLPFEQIKLVLDDRPQVLRMWKERGLFAIPVRGQVGEF